MNKKIIAASVIVVVTVVAFIVFWQLVYWRPTMPPGLYAIIIPHIYSTKYSIGVWNNVSTFDIEMYNEQDLIQEVTVQIIGVGEVKKNLTFQIGPHSTRNETISQKLSDLGVWSVRVQPEGYADYLDVYSFETLTLAEAIAIVNPPQPPIDWIGILQLVTGTTFSAIAAILAILAYRRRTRRRGAR